MTDQPRLPTDDVESLASTSDLSAGNPTDQAVDAVVYETHPAMLPRQADGDYPYGRPVYYPPAQHEPITGGSQWLADAVNWTVRSADTYFAALQRPPDFAVPKTFGMSAILGIMTALSFLFTCLRWLDAEPVLYFFFSALTLVICLAQMLNGTTPRLASIIAGAIMLPLFTYAATLNSGGIWALFLAICLVPIGAFLGYLNGTCAAGIFLVMNYLESYLKGQKSNYA